MSKELIETLDALNNERPAILQSKRRHFSVQSDMSLQMNLMRIGAEKDRILKFKLIATQSTTCYYNILD